MKLLMPLILLALTVLAPLSALAQVNTSTIAGVIKDDTGSLVANAKVTAKLTATGQQRETTTNDAGEYVVPQLAPGPYKLSVGAAGFQTAVVDNISLNIAERQIINVNLKLGQVSEQGDQ